MKRVNILDAIESLKKSGFYVSERCTVRPSCFDFIARREDHLVFIKVPTNLKSISERDASELRTISRCFSAKPLFISDGTAKRCFEDDTVYMRYNVWTVTLKTLENIMLRGMHPLVEAGPGGYYVNLNCTAIKEKRQCLGLSVGKLAEMGGTSRRTLYGYEKGLGKASVSVAYNLAKVLGVPVVQPLDLFQMEQSDTQFFSNSKHKFLGCRLLQKILKSLRNFGLNVFIARKAPFDFVARSPLRKLSIVGGIASRKEKDVTQRAKEILSFGELTKSQPVFITDDKQSTKSCIPLIHQKDLETIGCFEEFIKKL